MKRHRKQPNLVAGIDVDKMRRQLERKSRLRPGRAVKPAKRSELAHLANAVIRVGDGRGFIIDARGHRLIVTAGHCLPHLPPSAAFSNLEERTYRNLLGPLGEPPSVWAEVVFVDPVADLAVLSGPDGQELFEQSEAFDALVDSRPSLRVADAPEIGEALMLSLDGKWGRCLVKRRRDDDPVALARSLSVELATRGIRGGMSGSPILALNGRAIGVVCMGSGNDPTHDVQYDGPVQPRLFHHLPGWLLAALRESR